MDKFVYEDEVAFLPYSKLWGFMNTEVGDGINLDTNKIIEEMGLFDGDKVRITIEKI